MSSIPRCPRCGQPLALYEGEKICPNCTTYRPTPEGSAVPPRRQDGVSADAKHRPARTYEAWMAAVDAALVREVGVCSTDIPDVCYRDLYDSGCTPEEAADEAIENATGC